MKPGRIRRLSIRLFLLLLLIPVPAGRATIHGQVTPDRAIEVIRNELTPVIIITNREVESLPLSDLMRQHRIPAVSIAVIDRGNISWSAAFGLADSAEGRLADTETLFQAASISKPVAALAALQLVQEGQLDPGADINDYLRAWQLPDNEFTADQPVTLRHLLTHSGGLTVHGFPGYERSADQPTLVQILDGTGPANTDSIRVDTIPGEAWRYSGGGYTIMQQLLIDVTGRPFPEIMRERVLEPAGMMESTYEQPLPSGRYRQAATGYLSNGEPVQGTWHIYPEMAAAGLWTTPTDLARLALEVMRSFAGESDLILGQPLMEGMLRKGIGNWGLGFHIRGEGESLSFEHGGSNQGFRAAFFALARTGQGAVVMTNSDTGGEILGTVMRTLAQLYEWPTEAFPARRIEAVDLKRQDIRRVAGSYSFTRGRYTITFTREGDRLFVDYLGRWQAEVFPASERRWFAPADGTRFDFENSRGVHLQATLTLPAGYREGQRYPMLVYHYELMSQQHHNYSMPTYDDRPHMSEYASDGYLVLQPDIVYVEGRPGSSAMDCVGSAVRKVIELGYADPDHIGLQGHSWGGYQSSFMVTQTDLFAAVVTGAPPTNLVSFYNTLYKSSGTVQQGIMEVGQVRMGTTPFEDFNLYVEQSPIHHTADITTPFLILHGIEDGAVDWMQGLEYYNMARRQGKKVILLSYPG
ncbi:serine hydrolase, partial [Gemmatimonadota bacterium]